MRWLWRVVAIADLTTIALIEEQQAPRSELPLVITLIVTSTLRRLKPLWGLGFPGEVLLLDFPASP
jgi:hypothetical protein